MIIKHLKIEKEEYSTLNSEKDGRLENLSKVNIFIGANNSGKSRFMRSLFFINNNNKLKFLPNDDLFDKFINQANEFKRPEIKQKARYNLKNNIYSTIEQRLNEIEYLEESKAAYENLTKLYQNYLKNNEWL